MTKKQKTTPRIFLILLVFTLTTFIVPQAQRAVYGQKVPYNTYLPVVFNVNGCVNAIPYQYASNLSVEIETLDALNHQRAVNGGLSPLAVNESLVQIARFHSKDMADSGVTLHTGSDGDTLGDRFGWLCETFVSGGEIIGWSTSGSIDNMVNWWMNSPDHRALILSTDYTLAGVGYDYHPESYYDHYWTVNFASKASTRDGTASSLTSTNCTVEVVTFEEGGIQITSCE